MKMCDRVILKSRSKQCGGDCWVGQHLSEHSPVSESPRILFEARGVASTESQIFLPEDSGDKTRRCNRTNTAANSSAGPSTFRYAGESGTDARKPDLQVVLAADSPRQY